MKNVKKVIVFFVAALAIIISISLGFFLSSKKRIVCFYDLSENQCNLLHDLVTSFYAKNYKAIKVEFLALQSDQNLKEQLPKKTNLLFAPSSLQTSRLSAQKAPSSVVGHLPSSLQRLQPTPILLDSNLIEVNAPLVQKTQTSSLDSWSDIEDFALKAKAYVTQPVIFAGKRPETLLDILTAMTESLSGPSACLEASDKIKEFFQPENGKSPSPQEIASLITSLSQSPQDPLYASIYMLRRFYRLKLIKAEVFNMTEKDLLVFMQTGSAALAFLPLSSHRKASPKDMETWQSLPRACGNDGTSVPYYPSARKDSNRNLTASFLSVFPMSSKKDIDDLLDFLLEDFAQENLCRSTGLVPASKSCSSPDVQSSDARWWFAVTGTPILSLSQSAFMTDSDREMFAHELIKFIKN